MVDMWTLLWWISVVRIRGPLIFGGRIKSMEWRSILRTEQFNATSGFDTSGAANRVSLRHFAGSFFPWHTTAKTRPRSSRTKSLSQKFEGFMNNCQTDGSLTEVDRQTLRTVRRFLDGDFKNGVDPMHLYTDAALGDVPRSV